MNKMDDMKFFVWLNDQQAGPFDDTTIRKMLSQKQISHDTLICPESGDLDWTPVKELFFQDSMPDSMASAQSIEEILEQPDDNTRLHIRFNSGSELKVKAVLLYEETALAKVNSQKREAMELLKGVSTGIGAWGSIEWVLEASVVIGVVESLLSAGASSEGVKLLQAAFQAEQRLRKEGIYFPVSKIQFLEYPIPGFWKAFSVATVREETQVVKSLQLTKNEVRTVKKSTYFVHNGDEFITVRAEDDSTCSIRWSAVERHFYSKSM